MHWEGHGLSRQAHSDNLLIQQLGLEGKVLAGGRNLAAVSTGLGENMRKLKTPSQSACLRPRLYECCILMA